jgi:transcriptional regulator of acetoin/glycerol metabolism
VLREVVELCGWRMQEAADRLGISRVTLWRKMKDLGIEKNA